MKISKAEIFSFFLLLNIGMLCALPCKHIGEFYDEKFGCRSCPPCRKGHGVDLNGKVNRTANGMMSCYSCKECLPGTYQNDIEKPKACQPCNPCLNRETLQNCSIEANAICGRYQTGGSILLKKIEKARALPCKYIEEFYQEEYGCQPCPPCPKGYGVDLNEKVNRTANGMMSCYSCKECLPGTYQNDIEKPKACQPCNPCLNRETLQNCSIEANAICGRYQTGGSILLKKIEKARALPCKYIEEFYQEEYGCQPCPPCPKGYGVDLNEKVKANGMMSCYSCKECLPGTYQNDIEKPKACQPCNPCLNRETLQNCSIEANAICGRYQTGFFQTFENGIEVQPEQLHSRASQLRVLGITLTLGIIITIQLVTNM